MKRLNSQVVTSQTHNKLLTFTDPHLMHERKHLDVRNSGETELKTDLYLNFKAEFFNMSASALHCFH